MRLIRQILTDKVLATAMAVAIAYLLVLQGIAGSYARASTINPAENPQHVICTSSGDMGVASGTNGDPSKKALDCPCALLCRLANSAVPAILDTAHLFVETVSAEGHPSFDTPENAPWHQSRRLIAEPRAPPQIS